MKMKIMLLGEKWSHPHLSGGTIKKICFFPYTIPADILLSNFPGLN